MRLLDGRECLTCEYCKSEYLPEKNEDGVRVLDDPSELSCPVCAVSLTHDGELMAIVRAPDHAYDPGSGSISQYTAEFELRG